MRKHVFGRKLKRDANERKALFKGLLTDLVIEEKITTTEAKAKAIKPTAEKLITKAKVRGQEAKQFLMPYLSTEAVKKTISDLAKRFEKRQGGYTRIIKLTKRFSDNAPMVVIEWTERSESGIKNQELSKSKKVKKTTKTQEKAEATVKKSSAKQNTKEEKKVKASTKKKSSSGGK